jgi:hypothetical protein
MSPWHRRVSTAFFRSSVSFFQESLTGCGEEIDDKKGESYQIEGIYTKRLKKRSHNIQPSKILPIFLANTGSGYTLQPNSLKDWIKFLLNLLRLYSI